MTFAVRLAPGEEAPPMLVGQQLDVDLELERRDGVPSLPLAALRQEGAGAWSALVLDGDVARRRPVEIGLTTLDRAEITGGLDTGAAVIVPFGDTPADGQRVVTDSPGEAGALIDPWRRTDGVRLAAANRP